MKKKLSLILVLVLCVCSSLFLFGCGDKASQDDNQQTAEPKEVTLTFDTNGAQQIAPITQLPGSQISKPADPTFRGYNFLGWCSNKELTEEFAFSTMPSQNTTIYAKWRLINPTLEFTLVDDSYAVSGYNGGDETSVIIPEIYQGKKVTSIAKSAFSSYNHIENFDFPDSIISFGERAFGGCYNLISINIPSSLNSIQYNAFYGCEQLNKINVKDLKTWCNIENIENLTTQLDNRTEYLYLNDELITDLVLPQGVTTIHRFAFYEMSSITSVSLPDSLLTIESSGFFGCRNLTSLVIPSSVQTIETDSFSYCTSLTTAFIPKSVMTMGANVFNACNNLTINCEFLEEEKPSTWRDDWNLLTENLEYNPVNWGVTI